MTMTNYFVIIVIGHAILGRHVGGPMAVLQEGEGAVLVDSLVHVQITLLPQRTYLQHLLQHLLELLIMKGPLTLRS